MEIKNLPKGLVVTSAITRISPGVDDSIGIDLYNPMGQSIEFPKIGAGEYDDVSLLQVFKGTTITDQQISKLQDRFH